MATDAKAKKDAKEETDAKEEGQGAGSGWSAREIPLAENLHGFVDEIIENVRAFAPASGGRFPRCDMIETTAAYLLVCDLPGLNRKDISVTTEGEEVVIAGERAAPEWDEEATVRRAERSFGAFRRAMALPADTLIDDIGARYEDGVLTVTLPRRADSSGRKVDIEG